MHRLNLTINEALYDQARAQSFITKKSISQMVRDGLSLYLQTQTKENAKAQLVLAAKDEQEILAIIKADEWTTEDEFTKKFNL